MHISANQIKAARGLLDWTQDDLAKHAGLQVGQIRRFESGGSQALDVLDAIERAFTHSGIEFIPDGVRKSRGRIVEYNGAEGFRAFMDDVYETVRTQGGLVCVHNVRPDNWVEWLGREWNDFHTDRMLKIEKPFDFRITIRQDDYNLIGRHAEYRWLPESAWNDQSFYAYGDRLALMLFSQDDVNIRVIHSAQFAAGFRALFSLAWDNIPPIPPREER